MGSPGSVACGSGTGAGGTSYDCVKLPALPALPHRPAITSLLQRFWHGATMNGAELKDGAMGYCTVVDCDQLGVNLVTMPTSWGTWEHWVCDPHKARVDGGAVMLHDPDYRITLHPPAPRTSAAGGIPAQREQVAVPEQNVRPALVIQRRRSRHVG